jgi:hypothetical protein
MLVGIIIDNQSHLRASSAEIRLDGSSSNILSSKSSEGGGMNAKSSLRRRL